MFNQNEDVSDDEISDTEPQITSEDPNERKMARRLRIERRLENIRKQNMPEGEEEEVVVEKTLLQQQLQKSAELMEKLTLESTEAISNVRIANDGREADRRDEEKIIREQIIEQLREESKAATEMFNEIADKWEGILKYHDPLHINEALINQKEKCDELIKQKDGVIAMLRQYIQTAEFNFSKDQQKQNGDITVLSRRIENQILLMTKAYREEREMIQEVMMAERQALIEMNNKRWEELYKKRDQEDMENCECKFQQKAEFDEIMVELRHNFHERYREIKIQLGNDLESLQNEFESIKYFCLMNGERIDYNYHILKKREDENIIIKSQQKRRINKLQDVINDIRNKMAEYNETSKNTIMKLTSLIKDLQYRVLDIERQADDYQRNNDIRYNQVWRLNNGIASRILGQVLTTDRILHEQQLGLTWIEPSTKLMKKTDLPSYTTAVKTIKEYQKTGSSSTIDGTEPDSNETDESGLKNTVAYRKLLRHILSQVSDKTGFLIEDRLKEILKPHSDDERTLVRVDTIFAALDVRKKDDIDFLLKFFLPYTHCPICTASVSIKPSDDSETIIQNTELGECSAKSASSASSEISKFPSNMAVNVQQMMYSVNEPPQVIEEAISRVVKDSSKTHMIPSAVTSFVSEFDESPDVTLATHVSRKKKITKKHLHEYFYENMNCQFFHPLVISPVYVLRALKEFITRFYVPKEGVPTIMTRLAHKRDTVSRLIKNEDVIAYWTQYRKVFDDHRNHLWDGLYMGLEKYHKILKDRQKLSEEVVHLRLVNQELKQLLSRYMKKAKEKNKAPPAPCSLQRDGPVRPSPTQIKLPKF